MDSSWRTILWKQFGAAIDMLDNAVMACPDSLWRQLVWHDQSVPSRRAEFWYVTYHALFWLDLYLFGSEEGFAPPAPFSLVEQDDSVSPLPDQPFPGMNCAAIWRPCARNAAPPSRRCRTSRRSNPSTSAG